MDPADDLPTTGLAAQDESQVSMLRAVLDDRLVTLPNVISLSRLAFLPVFMWLVVSVEEYALAAILLAVLGATDWVDGQVARRTGQVSELGKILDPAADRLVLIASVVTIVVATDAVPVWISVPVLVREPVMFVAVPVLAVLGASRIDVAWVGKAGTFALMAAFPAMLYGASDAPGADWLQVAGYAAGGVGVVLSYYAAALYLPLALTAIRETRRA